MSEEKNNKNSGDKQQPANASGSIKDVVWPLKEDFSQIPAQMMNWVRECADAMILEDKPDEDGDIVMWFNRLMCDSDRFPDLAHQEGNPFDLESKNCGMWIRPGKPYSFFLPCTMVKKDTDVSVRGDWNCKLCNRGLPCRPALAGYYKFLQTYHPEEFIRQRQQYFENKDEIDGYLNYKYLLPELAYSPSELPLMPMQAVEAIRRKIDEYAYDISRSEEPNFPLSISDYTNTKTTSERVENWKNQSLNAFLKASLENSVAQKYSPADTEKMNYLMILKLLENPARYKEYVQRIASTEQDGPELTGGCYYGYVAGNDRNEVAERVKTIAENIQLKFGISNTYSKFTAMDLMQNLATVNDQPRYMPMTYTHIQDNTVYLITGLSEFTRAYRSASSDYGDPARRQAEHFIGEISEFKLGRFILLAGTENDIDEFLSLSPSLQIFFNNNKEIIRDKTIDEIYEIFKPLVDGKLGGPLPEDAAEQFKEYFTFNIGAFPFKNRSLAEYMANYMIQKHAFEFPQDLSGVKRKNFMEELDQLIGLKNIKTAVKNFYDFARFRQAARDNGIQLKASNMHMVFTGNPGTGKTTVARLLARALYDIGILKENKLVECEKKDLIGEYLGQTAPKTYAVIEKALGGVLFIDEAYSLASSGRNDSYNEEAIATLVKAMEDKRDNLVIIFAGYKNEMARFIASNPGIASRIGYTFHFEDYSEDELADMFFLKMRQSKLNVKESVRPKIKSIVQYFHNVENLGNGRFVDKLYQLTLQKRSAVNDPDIYNIDERSIPEIDEIIEYLPNNELMILPGAVKDSETRRVAFHEAGHAFLGRLLNAGDEIQRITVETSAGGVLGDVQQKRRVKDLKVREDYEKSICVLLGGLASEEVFLGAYSDGGSSDLNSAIDLARKMVEENGMSPLGFAARCLKDGEKEPGRVFEAVDAIISGQFERAKSILKEHEKAVDALAGALIASKTIDKEDIGKLFDGVSASEAL
jgi:AAA+ superfamily predicted ATPase